MDFSGYIVSSLVAIFVAHFGGKGNRTKWIAAACILMAFGSILLGFPFSKYEIMKSGGQRVGEVFFSNVLLCTKSILI